MQIDHTRYNELYHWYSLTMPPDEAADQAQKDAQYEADEREAIQLENQK